MYSIAYIQTTNNPEIRSNSDIKSVYLKLALIYYYLLKIANYFNFFILLFYYSTVLYITIIILLFYILLKTLFKKFVNRSNCMETVVNQS